MKGGLRGVLTVFLSLVMLMFLTFGLVLAEGCRMYFLRAETEQAADLAEFSVLSEFHPQLLEKYGIFFLDLNYGKEKEQTPVLHQRLKGYLAENAADVSSYSLNVRGFHRATDGGGSVFFRQAVAAEKFRTGIGILEELLPETEPVDLEKVLSENEAAAGEAAAEFEIPHISFPGIPALTKAVFGDGTVLSDKTMELSERIAERKLLEGEGAEERKSFADMQIFHSYVLGHCGYYGHESAAAVENVPDYAVEYVIIGKESDRENLEQVMWRIFLLRAAGNYAFYHQDARMMAETEGKAVAAVGVTGNAALIQAVQELFLLKEAIREGISQTGEIFRGGKVPLYENGIFSGVEMDYEDYLKLLLQTTAEKEKIFRCMDVAELDIRASAGNEAFCFDHCTDCFTMEWTYEFDSLFLDVPLMDGSVYRNGITRKMYYEM